MDLSLLRPNQQSLKGLSSPYLTGTTSLNLFLEGREAPLWHTTYISNTSSWSVAGINISSTSWLLGNQDLVIANKSLERSGLSFDFNVYSASYERAVFDLLYEFCVVRHKPVPNVQATDIDDVVNFSKIMNWIERLAISYDHNKIKEMKLWLENSDYDFRPKNL